MKPTFVTSNTNKVKEAEEILKTSLKRKDLDLKEIQAIDVLGVVRDKVQRAYSILKKPVIVEDTGLFLEELNGFPGALTKWTLRGIGRKGICNLMNENRGAHAKTAVAFRKEGCVKIFEGEIQGSIAEEPQGESEFGWDPIFIPKGYEKTFAQLGPEVKNEISMRKKAFTRLKEFLKDK